MRCSFCKSKRGGSYKDYCKGFSFNLCTDCCRELGFLPNNLDNQKKCNACGKYFIPKGSWQKNCIDCWIRSNPHKKKDFIIIEKDVPVQRKLIGVLYG